jgi:S-adenosylmethionine synthetase
MPAPVALESGHFLFTSESVGEGHPGTALTPTVAFLADRSRRADKICDQVSDAIVSALGLLEVLL